ncbi:MAG: M23 family metallopeptidase [Elusimicrobiota bacterium]|jgi:murein DD-endopeptidase MepM/ murein hydrolase activator NlpD|nr:M23 family metallopeptidase [Elusimicrobiota bacterium]
METITGNLDNQPFEISKFFVRWSVFFIVLLAAFFCVQNMAEKKASGIIDSVPLVEMPVFPEKYLLNDIYARADYLSRKVKGVAFEIYIVKPKDNLWKIAKKYPYSVHTLIGVNPQLETYNINTNQKLLIPSSGGSLHPIQKDDTWEKIAKRYDIDEAQVKSTNVGISQLNFGEYVFVPGKLPDISLMNKRMQEAYELRSLFKSPVGGRLSSAFGKRRHPVTGQIRVHAGIDIAVPMGTWIGAAASGTVILASTNVGHYGTAVFVDHGNGYVTHYGHLSSIRVRLGQKVRTGQYIGKSGATGRVTGPHLHFTIKKKDKALDPLKFLW